MEYEYVPVKGVGVLSLVDNVFGIMWGALAGAYIFIAFVIIEAVVTVIKPEIVLPSWDYWTTSLILLTVGAVINFLRTKRKAKKIAENPPKYKTYGSIEIRPKLLSAKGFRSMMVTADLLAEAFNKTGRIFSGSIEDFLEKGTSNGMNKNSLEIGFRLLRQNGYLVIEGDKFTPLSSLVDLMQLKSFT